LLSKLKTKSDTGRVLNPGSYMEWHAGIAAVEKAFMFVSGPDKLVFPWYDPDTFSAAHCYEKIIP
jgi:hypothetical protein